MRPVQLETITKAAQCSGLLLSDLQDAHAQACEDQPALEILLRDLISDAATLKRRLEEIQNCCR